MAKTKEQKKEIVEKIEQSLKNAKAAAFVRFSGISVAQESKMRRSMRSDGVGYIVAKKTLMRRALDNLGYNHQDVPMDGEVAVAYNSGSEDPTLPANRIFTFSKDVGPEKLVILGGIFDGKFVDAAMMNEIATIPPLPVLRGKLVNLLNSPLQRFAVLLDQKAQRSA
ncbi:MAG TPA: 50S ribosomal protein L10 [Candidatus Paceibacterota bacterium]|nr:50S ribosomal protein L10 [Candidatus Paceibacterota bacterium]